MSDIIRLDLETANAYLVKCNEGFILIDSGGYTFQDKQPDNKQELLKKKLIEHGCTPGTLKLVLLTHGDVDHSANCRFLQETYGTEIMIHKADDELTHDLTADKILSNFKFTSIFYRFISRLFQGMFRKLSERIVSHYEEFTPDGFLENGFDLNVYGVNAKVLHLPGHTKGSVGILFNNGDFISGDTLANIKKPAIAMNFRNYEELKESIVMLKTKWIRKVYPGHGEPFLFNELDLV